LRVSSEKQKTGNKKIIKERWMSFFNLKKRMAGQIIKPAINAYLSSLTKQLD